MGSRSAWTDAGAAMTTSFSSSCGGLGSTNGSTYAQRPMESNKSAALASSLTGIICGVRIRRSAGEHRTRLTSRNRQRRRHWPPDPTAKGCREFVDSRLRRSPPDRASAVPYGQGGENAMRFTRLAHSSAASHKVHTTPQQDRMNLSSGKGEPRSRLPAFSLFLPGSCPNYRDRRTLLPRHPHLPHKG